MNNVQVPGRSTAGSDPGENANSSTTTSMGAGPGNALQHGVGKRILKKMKARYIAHIDDTEKDVQTLSKHLHAVLFRKLRVPYDPDLWAEASGDQEDDDTGTEEGEKR